MRTFMFVLSLFCVAPINGAHAFAVDERWIEGTWVAQSRYGQIVSHVRIKDCGNGTPCGTLVSLEPRSNSPLTDIQNSSPFLKTRAIVGIPILLGFSKQGARWMAGRLYNPEDGKTFLSSLARGRNGDLLVTGCLGPFCQTKSWKRVIND